MFQQHADGAKRYAVDKAGDLTDWMSVAMVTPVEEKADLRN